MVGTAAGYAIAYEDGSWQQPQSLTSPQGLVSLTCVNSVFCTAVDGAGSSYNYENGSWRAGLAQGPAPGIVAVDCVNPTTCYSVNSSGQGNLESGADPSGDRYPFTSLSCVMAFCMAVDNHGESVTLGNEVNVAPGTGAELGLKQVDTPGTPLTSVSCAFETDTFCAAVDNVGRAFIYEGDTWKPARQLQAAPADPAYVSCTTASFCMAADTAGHTWMYWDATWLEAGQIDLNPGAVVTAVSCATQTFCMATTSDGEGYTFTNQALSWTPSPQYRQGWNAYVEGGPVATLDTCTWPGNYTLPLDQIRGCADAERAAEQTTDGDSSPPTTFGTP